jgi:putative membrane protein
MYRIERGRLVATTTMLTVVSLALVFAAALQAIPPGVLPGAPAWLLAAIPHVNAVISALAIVTISLGWRWIRAREVEKHRIAMVTSTLLFVAFLVLYLYKVAIAGPTPYSGPPALETLVYYPILAIHIVLAVVCLPLLYYVLGLAIVHEPAELAGTLHPRLGRVAASLWLISFALGIVVYALLYLL